MRSFPQSGQTQLQPLVIDTYGELQALAPEWLDLWLRCKASTPFQSPDWLMPWLRWRGRRMEIRTITVRAEGRLVAILPIGIDNSASTVRLLGYRDSDYLDLLVDESYCLTATRLVMSAMVEALPARFWEFEELPENAILLRRGAGGAERFKISYALRRGSPCWAIDLSAGEPGARFRRRLKQYRRRLESEAQVDFELADDASLGSVFASLVDLHSSCWNARGEQGCFAQPGFIDFHEEASRNFLRRGILRLYLMRVNRAPAAALYGFLWNARYYAYLQGYDKRFSAHRVGSLLLDYAIEQAQREGALVFDLMRGAESYKRLWGAHEAFNSVLTVSPRLRVEGSSLDNCARP